MLVTWLTTDGSPTPYGKLLLDYFVCRATMLREHVEPMLMTAEQAKKVFERLRKKLHPKRAVPLNKQSGEKKVPHSSRASSTC